MTKHIAVPEELLEKCAAALWICARPDLQKEIRALLDGPGVEPVAWVKYEVGQLPKFVPVINGHVTFECSAIEALEYEPLYLSAPSAPIPSDDQGPFSRGRLKRLVTQVFGEGWKIIPPEAPVQAVPDGWKEAAIAWEVCASIHRQWAKGKDALFSTRQADFVSHADEARAMLAAAPQPPKAEFCQECGVLLSVYKHRPNCRTGFNVGPQPPATTDKENGE